MTTPRSQVFGTKARFNEDVVFLKNVEVGEGLFFARATAFNAPVTFEEDVIFEKNIFVRQNATIDQNVSVGGISTFSGFVDANDDVDVAKTLTVQQRLNVGVSGTVLSADAITQSVGIGTTNPITKFQFNSKGDTVVSFDKEGKVGIGTTNVGHTVSDLDDSTQGKLKLDVQGSVAIDRNIYDSAGAPGQNNFFLSRDEFGIRWVNIVPQDPVGIFLQDEGTFIPITGIAQSFTTLNFVQGNSQGTGVDNLIPTANNEVTPDGLAVITTQDLWGYTGNNIYRMSNVGVNNSDPGRTLDISGTLRATGIVEFTNSTVSSGSDSGALVVTGGTGIGQNLNVGGSAAVLSNTSSSGSDSGALVVTGGVGIGENLNMGGNIDVDGTGKIGSTQTSTANDNGALIVGGGLGLGENLNMGGNIDVDGSGRIGALLELDGPLKDFNDSTAIGKTDYRLSSIYHDSGSGIGVSWRPPGVQTKKTIWVSKNGSDLNSGLLEGDAKASLGGAAAVAQEGDTIKIRPGKYIEDNPVGLRTDVSVTGEDLRLVTIVPKNKNSDVIHVRRGCLVENLSFAGGVVGTGVEIGCDGAAAVAFPPTPEDIAAGIGSQAVSGFTGVGPADEGSSGRWRSPYIRNCTNFMTGSIGMKINGDHANAAFTGINSLGQDLKSMVCDSFTQYNEAGIGVSITNDGYAQLVSIFTIGCEKGIYVDSGGQCDLTNSNSSFGIFGLVADGVGDTQFTGTVNTATVAEGDSFVLNNVKDDLNNVRKPFDGQAFFFKLDLDDYADTALGKTGITTAPLNLVRSIKITDGGSGYSQSAPPNVTITAPAGPEAILAELSANVSAAGTITSVDVIASGRNFLPTGVGANQQDVTISFSSGSATAVAEMDPIFFTVETATEPTNAGLTTVTFNEFVPYAVSAGSSSEFKRISRIITSSHSFEYIGAGTDINSSNPFQGGEPIPENEIVAINGGQVPFTSTDQKGNFRIGQGLTVDQTTSTIRGRDFNRAIQAQLTPLILALR